MAYFDISNGACEIMQCRECSEVKRCKLHLVLVLIQNGFAAAAALALASILLEECCNIETYMH